MIWERGEPLCASEGRFRPGDAIYALSDRGEEHSLSSQMLLTVGLRLLFSERKGPVL